MFFPTKEENPADLTSQTLRSQMVKDAENNPTSFSGLDSTYSRTEQLIMSGK